MAKEAGLFRRNVVETIILDAAVGQMVDWAAALGAGRPKLALQVLAEMFRDRDWSNDSAPSIQKFIEELRAKSNEWAGAQTIAPREIIRPTKFTKLGKTIDASKLEDSKLRAAFEYLCLQGLLWGIANPKTFGMWYSTYVEDVRGNREHARVAGLDIEEPENLSDFFATAEQIVLNYERDI
jgi:hypothetical protein